MPRCRLPRILVRFDWNDLRFFAAVLEHGSTGRAAKALGVDPTTCARRIAALEAALGVDLFVRDATGFQPTPAAEVLRPAVHAVSEEVGRFAHQAETAARRATRRIRVTAEEFTSRTLLVPALRAFAERYPDVQVEVDVSSTVRDLQAGEADIAIRPGDPPDEPSLIRRKLRDDPWAVYCTEAYAAARGAPRDFAELVGHPIALLDSAVEGARAFGVVDSVRQVLSSISAVQAMILTGDYIGPLPRVVAERNPELVRCFPVPPVSAGFWLVYPERLRGVPEVRALAQCIADAFKPTS
jgi:DNA-binding transcriptional LysR family regulator